MKRFFAGLLIMGMMGTALTGCNSQGTDSASGNASGTETTVLVLANSAPASEENHMYQYCEKFKELVEEKSSGCSFSRKMQNVFASFAKTYFKNRKRTF